MVITRSYDFIEDLPANWRDLASVELPPLVGVWKQRANDLRSSKAYQIFMDRMRRQIAIETGIIERLYSIDRGITQLLIERGIDEALIPHGATSIPAAEVIAIVRDQESAVESLFDFVSNRRQLSTSYIKQLHQMLTQHQESTDALVAETGQIVKVPLLQGEWKKMSNNPQRPNGEAHHYCPPEHTSSEMDNLVRWHIEHVGVGVPPEIEAAWLHHRFTQIHPFQDGNGRVARCLASLVFLQEGWQPLTLTNDERAFYIDALEAADAGDLKLLVDLFAERQKQAFIRALSLSDQALTEARHQQAVIASVAQRLKTQQRIAVEDRTGIAREYAGRLQDRVLTRFHSVVEDLKRQLQPINPRFDAWITKAEPDDGERSMYHTIPIVMIAKRLNYFANRRAFSSWVEMGVSLETRIEVLLSFHALGHENVGVFAASASAYHRELSEEGPSTISGVEPLSPSPFQFSYMDTWPELSDRFDRWLDDVVVAGLKYWQQDL